MNRIALIDDDQKLGELLKQYFSQFELETVQFTLPSEALSALKREKFDAIILDVMLPEMDGFEVCKKIRGFSDLPILMLTARGETSDKVLGLELGVDDYLPKPFEARELVARMKSLIRRYKKTSVSGNKLRSGSLVLDTQLRTAFLEDQNLNLSTHEYELLKLLMSYAGQSLSRDRIMDELRGVDWEAYNRSIDVAISRLRQKLKDPAKTPVFLRTVWGEGYCFIAPVEETL
ncbi:DNA-binding response regulator [Bdellovibrio bacteriovorus]|uniref:DNA-binding response regulator n=1 Tax=Bdellovibrio bacteriovorus TaxID=959 RepID=A0A161PST8_BDEBC|nr:response regulator transcription factor [Bdellovibrio bacteriovorus]KYG68338.1 DNA-binding response regulator [Bdellovibrio bacteriovorus]